MTFQVDFLDTAGDNQFPAMRRLSIANSQAFLLVYAIDDPNSFDMLKQSFEEIREGKPDYQVRKLAAIRVRVVAIAAAAIDRQTTALCLCQCVCLCLCPVCLPACEQSVVWVIR